MQAEITVDSISSAIPLATFPTILYVAGATNTTSAQSANEICSTSKCGFLSHISTYTLFLERVSNVSGVIIFVAFSVIITLTLYPFFFNFEIILADLYAEIPPVTPISIFFIITPYFTTLLS